MPGAGSNKKRKRSRKGKQNPKNWEINISKKRRRQRQKYTVRRRVEGKMVTIERPSKNRRPRCTSAKCKGCRQFSDAALEEIKEKFVNLTQDEQRSFIQKSVSTNEPKRRRTKNNNPPRRKYTMTYKLKLNEKWIQVCAKNYKNTLILHADTIKNALERVDEAGMPNFSPKTRGSHGANTPSFKKRVDHMTSWIEAIPKMESHYCRGTTDNLYFDCAITSISQLHSFYVDDCKLHNIKHFSRYKFDNFLKDKKYKLFRRKNDLCNTCVGYELKNVGQVQYDTHIKNKREGRQEKEDDTKNSDDTVAVYCADTEAQLTLPRMNANAFYFRNKQILKNWTTYNLKNKEVMNYMWTESNGASNGSCYSSLFVDFITTEKEVNPLLKTFIIYSDGCSAQNRCCVLTGSLLKLSHDLNITIIQKYLEVGHTQMEVDSVHAAIEKKIRQIQQIYMVEEYQDIIEKARKSRNNSYKTKICTYKFFKDFKSVNTVRTVRPGEEWVNYLKQIKCQSGKIFTKLSHTEEWKELPNQYTIPTKKPPQLYKEEIKISANKYKHLMEMINQIPQYAQDYYKLLAHD